MSVVPSLKEMRKWHGDKAVVTSIVDTMSLRKNVVGKIDEVTIDNSLVCHYQ
jgi:hypothetical protein